MKERLTGAIILVALIVLLVPELLSGPQRARAPSTSSAEEPPLRSYTINLADDSRAHRDGPANSALAMPPLAATEQPVAEPESVPGKAGDLPQSTAGSAQAQGPAPDTATPSPAPVAPAKQSVGAQVKPAPAQPTSTSNTSLSQSHPARAETIKKASAVTVRPAPGSASRPASPTGGGAGWMVQLGVFASRQNAEHLALEVRTKGFKASVSEVTASHHPLYRVRVGPAADRNSALELQSRLRAAGRPTGTLVPPS